MAQHTNNPACVGYFQARLGRERAVIDARSKRKTRRTLQAVNVSQDLVPHVKQRPPSALGTCGLRPVNLYVLSRSTRDAHGKKGRVVRFWNHARGRTSLRIVRVGLGFVASPVRIAI